MLPRAALHNATAYTVAARLSGHLFSTVALLFALALLSCDSVKAFQEETAYNPFHINNLEIVTEAENAVAAKEMAMDASVIAAYSEIIDRMVRDKQANTIKIPSADTIWPLINSFTVEREIVGTQTYTAYMSFYFKEEALRRHFRTKGVKVATVQAPRMVIIPLYQDLEGKLDWQDIHWRHAWERQVDPDSLVPMVVIKGDTEDRAYETPDLVDGNVYSTEMFRVRYSADALAVATIVQEEEKLLRVRVLGDDALGNFTFERRYDAFIRSYADVAEEAVDWIAEELRERWKSAVIAGPGARGAPNDPIISQEPQRLSLVFNYGGEISRWLSFEDFMSSVPGISKARVQKVEEELVHLTLAYVGAEERLADAFNASGFYVEMKRSKLFVTPAIQ